MTLVQKLRPIEAHELPAIVGGQEDEIVVVGARRSSSIDTADFLAFRAAFDANLFGPMGCFGGGGGSPSYPPDWVDNDGDSVPDGPPQEPIVVTGDPRVVEAWRGYVTFQVDLVIYGSIGIGALTGLGLPTEIALGLALGGAALGAHRQAAIDWLTQNWLDIDAADGGLDGFSPALPPGHPQPGTFVPLL